MRKTINIEGLKLSYRDENSDRDFSIVLIHGNSQASSTFLHQLRSEALAEYRLLALDLPGHGYSERAEKYSVPLLVRALTSFVTKLELKNFILVGHSLGGHLVLEALSSLNPRGILVSGAPALTKPLDPTVFHPHPSIGLFYEKEVAPSSLELLLGDLYRTPEERAAGKFEFLQTDPSFRPDLLASIGQGEFQDELCLWEGFSGAKRLLGGTDDKFINYVSVAGTIPVVKIIPGGHNIHQENESGYNQEILSLLQEIRGTMSTANRELALNG